MKIRNVAMILCALLVGCSLGAQTRVGIRGSKFTLNGEVTYTAASGFSSSNQNIEGTLLNVRAVHAIFGDANYPQSGSRTRPSELHFVVQR